MTALHPDTTEVVDDYFGRTVADRFRWLETPGPDVEEWVEDQTARTRRLLDGHPLRDVFSERLGELLDTEVPGVPFERGARLFEVRQVAGTPRPSLWLHEDDTDRELFDPASLAADAALIASVPSPDGSTVALGLQFGGSDWLTWRFLEVTTGALLPDVLTWNKIPWASWLPDGTGLVYSSLAEPPADQALTATNTGQQIRTHILGTSEDEDACEYESADVPWMIGHVTADGRWLVVELLSATVPDQVLARPLSERAAPFVALTPVGAPARFLGAEADEAFILSHADAPAGAIVGISITHPERRRVVVADQPSAPVSATGGAFYFGGQLLCVRAHQGGHQLTAHDPRSGESWTVPFPEPGSVSHDMPDYFGLRGSSTSSVIHLAHASAVSPKRILRVDLSSREAEWASNPPTSSVELVSERHTARSADGALVHMSVVRAADTVPDGCRPTIFVGYGGFAINIGLLGYQAWSIPWLERGGVFVVMELRGGSEQGEAWHAAAMRHGKPKTFDDAIACIEHLIEQGWTSAQHVALNGASNGGLMVGAVLTRRPDLLAAAVPEVGTLDMLRYHRHTGAAAWASEYGISTEADDIDLLLSYSPLHRVEPRDYPAVLVVTGEHDDRVPPGTHSYKFTAALQANQLGGEPIALRVERGSGHGAGKTTACAVAEKTDILCFLAQATGLR